MVRTVTLVTLVAAMAISLPAQGQAPAPGPLLQDLGPGSLGELLGPVETDPLFAQANRHLRTTLVPSHSVVAPGGQLTLAVELAMDESYYLYGPVPRGEVQPRPLRATVEAPGLQAGPLQYPDPHVHPTGEGEVYDEHFVYDKPVRLYVPLTVPADAQPGTSLTVGVTLRGQLCRDPGLCLEMRQVASVQVTVGPEPVANPAYRSPEGTYRTVEGWQQALPQIPGGGAGPARLAGAPGAALTAWAALPLAVLAGLILNVMPCVLPVVPLKILSLMDQAHGQRRRAVTLGLAFAGGIVLFFALLAAISTILRLTIGRAITWGELLSYPAVVIGLALLMVVLALNLFNLFTVSLGTSLAGRQTGGGHGGSVFMGFVAAVLSTPCSFAVLAAVLGWAQLQPVWLGVVTFLLIGVGMALPHAVLASFPQLLERLPRPGPWMEYLKQGMGFLLLLVAAYLLTLLGDAVWMGWVAAYAVVLSVAVWMAGTWVSFATAAPRRLAVRGLALLLAVGAGWWMLGPPAEPAIPWQPYDPALIQAARDAGQPVLVKFTADWCTECKLVDYRVYRTDQAVAALRDAGVLAVLGDITRADMPARALLTHLGEPGPPVTVIYPPGQDEPLRLRGAISLDDLLGALETAAPQE